MAAGRDRVANTALVIALAPANVINSVADVYAEKSIHQ